MVMIREGSYMLSLFFLGPTFEKLFTTYVW